MRKNHLQLDAITPNRVACEVKSLHTPVNSKDPSWSPILHAETPNLNVAIENLERTPALLKSLGISTEDANVSWRSCMATPSAEVLSPNITVYHTPNDLEEKSKSISTTENVGNSRHRGAETYHFLIDKPASKFIYPNPVYVEVQNANNQQMPVAFDSSKDHQKSTLELISYSDEESAHSPVLTMRRKIRKSLKFNYESYSESSGGQTSSSCGSPVRSLLQEETKVISRENEGVPVSFKSLNFDLLSNKQNLFLNSDGNCSKQHENAKSTAQFQFSSNTHDCLIVPESKNIAQSSTSLPNQKKLVPCPSTFKHKNTPLDTEFSTVNEENLVTSETLTRTNSLFHDFGNVRENSNYVKELQRLDVSSNSSPIPSEFVTQPANVDLSNFNTDTTVDRQPTEFSTPKKNSSVVSNDKASFHLSSYEIGFTTAAGRTVSISKQALARAEALFESDQPSPKTDYLDSEVGPNTASEQHLTGSKNSLPRVTQSFEATKSVTDPEPVRKVVRNEIGFRTATGKAVSVSEQALTRARALFENDQPSGTDHVNSGVGFNTANGKRIVVSENSLSKAKLLFDETELDVCADSVGNVASKNGIGFSTAAGKAISISEEALTRAKTLFENEQSSPPTNHTDSGVGFNSASGKHVAASEKSFPRSKPLFEETKVDVGLDPVGNAAAKNLTGFTTAAGKAVSISEEALAQARALFESQQPSQEADDANSSPGLETSNRKNLVTSEKALNRNRVLFGGRNWAAASASSDRPCFFSKQSATCQDDSGEESNHRKRKMEDGDNDDDWASSPTIGKKKRKDSPSVVSISPESLLTQTPLSAFDCDPTNVLHNILSLRKQARSRQKSTIEAKKEGNLRIVPKAGSLYLSTKSCASLRKNWVQFVGQSALPKTCSADQLLAKGVTASVCLVSPANAASFTFYGWEYFPVEVCRNNSEGFQLGEFLLILADDNTISCEEIGNSLMASANVDPSLISQEWIRNHFRWIVWKLACMEVRLPDQFAQQCLTPWTVLTQLKYRYDREIDRCERSALKRIIEQDDAAAKTMILCVAGIEATMSFLELTDGWYFIRACCDAALKQLIANGKISIGVKLIVSGAELVSPGPTSPLEIGSDTYLKISANSCRRARWHSRLGFYRNPQPIWVSLRSVLPEGGLIPLLKVMIVRVYPLVYMGKTAEGKTQFRSERCYRKESESAAAVYERMMEKMMEDVVREEEQKNKEKNRKDVHYTVKLTDEEKRNQIVAEVQKRMASRASSIKPAEWVPLLKVRIIDESRSNSNSAILSVWRPTEEVQHCLKENQSYHLYHVTASGIRFGELQLNSGKQTRWQAMKNGRVHEFGRCVTSFQTASQPGFKPAFNELDVVGLVVFVAQQPNRNSFQTAVLSDGINYFGIKCWISFDDYALTNVIVTGSFLSFSNLQWRSLASKDLKIPFAFVHEGTLVSSRPAQKHLESALNDLKRILSDPSECISQAALHVNNFFGNIAPNSATRRYSTDEKKRMHTPTCSNEGKNTPSSAMAANPSVCRTRLLEKYGTPPSLSPWIATPSPEVRHKFKPPTKTANK